MYRFLALAAVLIIAEELAEYAYKRTASYRASRAGYAHIHGEIPEGLETVSVGSGPVLYGISFEYCPRKGFNLATAPQNFINGFRLIKRFTPNIAPGATVIIVIMSPMSFGRNNDYNSPGYYDKFYGVLPPGDIPGYSRFRAFLIAHPLMLRAAGKLRRTVSRIFSRAKSPVSKDIPGIIQTWTSEFGLDNLTDPSQAEAHRDAFNEKIGILSEEIVYCKARGWHPVLVIPPVPEKTRSHISPEFVKAFVGGNMEVLTRKFPDVRVLDYYEDSRFTPDMFSDGIFLSAKGREAFSRILFGEIYEGGAK